MQYGMFIMPFHDPAKPLAQCYDEDLELVVMAEEMGFSEFWVGEHHTMLYENIVMPEAFIGKALGLTSTIRLGTAPTCLPYHHPALVAGRLAFLDHLSHGRLNVCFGPGSVTTDLELFGIDPKDNGAMADESAEMILKIWSQDPPYHLNGRFWNIDLEKNVDEETLIGYLHKPLQQPHPPIFAPAMSMNSNTMKTAGRRGWLPISSNLIAGNVVADNWQTYESAAREAGGTPDRADWRVCRSIFIGDTCEEAEAAVRSNSLGRNFQYIGGLFDKGLGRKVMKRNPDAPDSETGLDYLMQEQIIHGDVDEVVRRLGSLMDETGDFGTLLLMGYDWDDRDAWTKSMRLFVDKVIPELS
ncbi:MAG: LLM class flavin-dependent oxidoreductase [Candidatus Latescibacteria bacterium]|jgi:alkanesulfonate monooxygenase SsuD/methylene tetrahydromethanopterin reductase-like flavin-dependent oxidoreductase (luciferase family)|nr:LLM class flavin-dependent oxidoreductase [Candidatus Latescibacterota bacterium]